MSETETQVGISKEQNMKDLVSDIGKYSTISRLVTRDLNNLRSSPTFTLYTKDDITKYVGNP